MSRRALIAVLLLAGARDAGADDKWDASYAFGGGFQSIAGEGYGGVLLQIQLGRRLLSHVAVSGSAELASASNDELEGGILRGLVGVDLHVLRADGSFTPSLIASLGTGTETIAWERGTLTRPLTYVAFEYRGGFRMGTSGVVRNLSSLAFRFGVRAHVSPGVSTETVAKLCRCEAPMDNAPASLDAGVSIYMGLVFGR